MALLGDRAPFSLKVLLVAIAVIDDLGAILVIAIFYAENLDYNALIMAAGVFADYAIFEQKKNYPTHPLRHSWIIAVGFGFQIWNSRNLGGGINGFNHPTLCERRP